jgi:hypothetical protein
MTATGPSLLSSLDLCGRAFRAREGRTSLRGWVTKTSFDGTYARIEVSDVQRKGEDDAEWFKVNGFDAYVGHDDITSVRANADGSVRVSITYIGQVQILPPGVAP